jgi:hypothetical protein
MGEEAFFTQNGRVNGEGVQNSPLTKMFFERLAGNKFY